MLNSFNQRTMNWRTNGMIWSESKKSNFHWDQKEIVDFIEDEKKGWMRNTRTCESGWKSEWDERRIVSGNRLTMENVDWFVVNKFHSEMQSPAMRIVFCCPKLLSFHSGILYLLRSLQCRHSRKCRRKSQAEADRVRGRQCSLQRLKTKKRVSHWQERERKRNRENPNEACLHAKCSSKDTDPPAGNWSANGEHGTQCQNVKKNNYRILIIEYCIQFFLCSLLRTVDTAFNLSLKRHVAFLLFCVGRHFSRSIYCYGS